MKQFTAMLALVGAVMTLGLLTIAFGQNVGPQKSDEERILDLEDAVGRLNTLLEQSNDREEPARDPRVEGRIAQLEQTVGRLSVQLQQRTDTPGPQDRINRDFNLDQRLNDLDRRLQQIEYSLTSLNNQVMQAVNSANQAQRDAQMAQQAAQLAASRIN